MSRLGAALLHLLSVGCAASLSSALAEAAARHALLAETGRRGVALAKPLSEALMAAAAINERHLSHSIIVKMASALDGDSSNAAAWLSGRVLLAASLLADQGSPTPASLVEPHRAAVYSSLSMPLSSDDPCAGWACAYWVATEPAEHARWRPRLEAAAQLARDEYDREPKLLSSLLWTHGMNAFALASAGDRQGFKASSNAFAHDVDAESVAGALMLMPDDDYPLWLASFLLAGASKMGDMRLVRELTSDAAVVQPGPRPSKSTDAMLALAMRHTYLG